MEKLKKAIKGIKQCMMSSNRDEFETQCVDCPYFDPEVTVEECMKPLREDILELLTGLDGDDDIHPHGGD